MQNHLKKDMFAFLIPFFTVFAAGLCVCAWDFVRQHGGGVFEPSALNLFGAFLVLAGLINNIVSQVIMGRAYSATLLTREDHPLITRGQYRYVRHPIYFGVTVAMTGIGLFTSSLLGLIVMWGAIPFIFRRIRLEEAMLIDEFGAEYEAYKERTKKLVPFLH